MKKIALLSAFICLFCSIVDVNAQTVNNKDVGVLVASNTLPHLIFDNYESLSGAYGTTSPMKTVDIEIYEVDNAGNIVGSRLNQGSNLKDKSWGGFLGISLYSSYQLNNTYCRIKELSVVPSNLSPDYYGKTLLIRVKYKNVTPPSYEEQEDNYYLEVVGAPIVQNTTAGAVYSDELDAYKMAVCSNENFTISISNVEYPFGNTPTYLGNTFKAVYRWDYTNTGWITSFDYGVGTSLDVTGETGPSAGSGVMLFNLTVDYVDEHGNLISVLNNSTKVAQSLPMSVYRVHYDSKIDAEFFHNSVKSNSFSICEQDNENIVIETLLTRDGSEFDCIDWILYKKSPSDIDWVSVQSGNYDPLSLEYHYLEELELGTLPLIGNADTEYKYKLAVIDRTDEGKGCPAEYLFDVTIIEQSADIQLPTAAEIGNLCEGGTVSFDATVDGKSTDYTYSWEYDGTAVPSLTSTTFSMTGLTAGSHTATLTVGHGGCEVSESVSFTVTAKPVLTSLGDVEICVGDVIEIGADCSQSGCTFTWSPSEGEAVTYAAGTKRKVSPTSTKVYTITATNDKGCESDAVSVKLTVNKHPDIVSGTASPATVCEGGTTDLSVLLDPGYDTTDRTFIYTWSWTDKNGYHSEPTTTAAYTATIASSTAVTVSVTDDKSCSSSSSYTINVTAEAEPDFSPAFDVAAICGNSGNTIGLKMNPANSAVYSYEITPLSGAPAPSGSDGVYTVQLASNYSTPQTFSYNVVAKTLVASCPSETKKVSFDVSAIPADPIVSIDPASGICEGSGNQFIVTVTNAVEGFYYQWYKNGVVQGSASSATQHTFTDITATTTCQVQAIDMNFATECVSSQVGFDLVVNARPAKPTATVSTSVMCSNALAAVTLSVVTPVSGETYTWYNSATNVSVGTGSSLSVSPSATTSYYVIADNGCPSLASDAVTVTVNPAPTLTSAGDKTTCLGTAQTLKVTCDMSNDVMSYSWSPVGGSDVAMEGNGSAYSVNPSTVGTHTYTVTATNTSTGCVSTATINITVNQKPEIKVTAAKTTICAGESQVYSISNLGYTVTNPVYEWATVVDGVRTDQGNESTLEIAFDKDVQVVAYLMDPATGCIGESTLDITVIQLPEIAPAASPAKLCDGGSFDISMNGSGTYNYTVTPLSSAVAGTLTGDVYSVDLPSSSLTSDETYQYQIVATDPITGCASAAQTVDVVVNYIPAAPEVTLSHASICKDSGESVKVSVVSPIEGATYSWFKEGVQITGATSNSYVFTDINVTTNCSVIVEREGCISDEYKFVITVNDYPAVPVITLTTKDVFCSNETINPVFHANGGVPEPGVTYTWYYAATHSVAGEGESFIPTSVTQTTSYYAIASNTDTGCRALTPKSEPKTITVNQAPVLGAVSPSTAQLCDGKSMKFSVTPLSGDYVYEWYSVDGGTTAALATGTNLTSYTYSAVGAENNRDVEIYVTATDPVTNCASTPVKADVTINRAYDFSMTAPYGYTICDGQPFRLEVTLDETEFYIDLTYNNTKQIHRASAPGIVPVVYEFVPQKGVDYSLNIIDNTKPTCFKSNLLPIVIVDSPAFAISGNPVVCENGTLQLSVEFTDPSTDPSAYTYEWSFGGAVVGNNRELSVASFAAANAGEYSVLVTDKNGINCATTQSITTTLVPQPVVTLTSNMATVCAGGAIDFEATAGYDSYEFFVNSVTKGTQTSEKITLSSLTDGDVVSVIATHGGCSSVEKSVTVARLPEFTPTIEPAAGFNFCEGEEVSITIKSTQAAHLISDVKILSDDDVTITLKDLKIAADKLSAVAKVTLTEVTAASVELYATVTTENSCAANTSAIEASLSSVVLADFTANDMCEGTSHDFIMTSSGALGNTLYQFLIDGVVVQDYSTVDTYSYTASTIGTIELTVNAKDESLGASACVSTITKTFDVADSPAFESGDLTVIDTPVSPGNYVSCAGQPITFVADILDNLYLQVIFDGVVIGYFNDEQEFISTEDYPTILEGVTLLSGHSVNRFSYTSAASSPGKISYEIGFAIDQLDGNHTVSFKLVDPSSGCESPESFVSGIEARKPIVLSVPAPFTIEGSTITLCEGSSVVVTPTSEYNTTYSFTHMPDPSIYNATSFTAVASAAGDVRKVEIQGEQAGCGVTMWINTVAAPVPTVSLTYADDVALTKLGTDYEVCAGQPFKLVAGGAFEYELTVDKDGVDVTDQFVASATNTSIEDFVQSLTLNFDATTAGTNDYNLYTFSFAYSIGSCVDYAQATLRLYALPDALLDLSPVSPVIEGTIVTATVTSTAGVKFDFYADGDKLSPIDNTSNVFDYTGITKSFVLSVDVINAHGCITTVAEVVEVLDQISSLPVVASSNYYCEGTQGVDIEVANPEVGITYELVGCASCSPITVANAGDKVIWTNVENVSAVETYKVIGYHLALPSVTTDMANTVTVTKVSLPVVQKVLPYDVVQTSCTSGDVIKLESSQVGVVYTLFVNGSPIVTDVPGTGAELELSAAEFTGVYTVKASMVFDGVGVCPVDMDSNYKVDIPAAGIYNVGPANGKYCENTAGVVITLSDSDVDFDYYLYKDGVPYLDAESNPVNVAGTGEAISFPVVSAEATYTVMADYNGCKTPMLGSVVVTRVNLPIDIPAVVSNNGHFCEDDAAGVTITLADQEAGKTYTLLRNGLAVDQYVGLATGVGFDFVNITLPGSYTIAVADSTVADACSILLSSTFEVVEDKLPNNITVDLAQDTICETNVTELTLYNTMPGVQYDIYVNDVLYRTVVPTEEVHHETGVDVPGIYRVTATRTIVEGGVVLNTCSRAFESVDTLNIVPRPVTGPQIEEFKIYDDIITDPCYGVDIAVINAQAGLTYKLYLLDEFGMPQAAPVSQFVAVADGSTDIFHDIRNNNGMYRVAISNGFCDDFLAPDLNVTSDKFVDVQTVIAESSMCQGDQGVLVTLANSEANVIYMLRDAQGNTMAQHKPEAAGTFTFDVPLLNEGKYTVVGTRDGSCETLMSPEIDFKVNALPMAFELQGNTKICAGESTVTLSLSDSEIGVNYVLYSIAVDETLSIVEQKEGTGEELFFAPVPAGRYMASSRNLTTQCTSNMKGILTVVQGEEIKAFDITDEFISCSGITEYSFPADSLTLGATYYIMSGDQSPETDEPVYEFTCETSTAMSYTFAAGGEYTLWASYDDLSCLTPMKGKLNVVSVAYDQFRLTSNEEVNCSASTMELYLSGSQAGITYYLEVAGSPVADSEQVGTGEKLTWSIAGEDIVDYEVWASDAGKCPQMIDHLNVNFTTVVVPDISLDFYIEGVKQEYTQGDTIDLCPGVAFSFLGQLHNMAASRYTYKLNDVVVQDGVNPLFIPDVAGTTGDLVYSLTVSTATGCEFDVEDKFIINILTSYEQFRLSSNQDINCEVGNMELYLSGSQADITYQLKVGGNVVADTEKLGNGSKLTWPIDGEGIVVYEVWASDAGKCPYMLDRLSVDFDRVVVPQASIDFYLQGQRVNYAAGDTIEVCSNASVNFLAQVPNLSVTKYTFKMNGRDVHSNSNPLFIPYLEDKTGTLTYTLDISSNNKCDFAGVDTIVIKIADVDLTDQRLFAQDNYPEYCEGEDGVRLYFAGAEKGVIYRLFRQSEDGFDEMMEMVEIPSYAIGNVADTLWFESWTAGGGKGTNFAQAGVYYVEIESLEDGCMFRSNAVEVIVNPLPVKENTEVYFNVPQYDVNDIDRRFPKIDPETKSYDYGLLDAGFLVLEHAQTGVRYDLFNVDSSEVLQTIYAIGEDQTLFFGPINQMVSDEPEEVAAPADTAQTSTEDIIDINGENKAATAFAGVFGAEGIYTIVATDTVTGCTTEIGNVEFIEDELVAYNAYIFLNKGETSVKKSLIPSYGQKGNHKFIDWSSKIDLVYVPKYQASTDGTLEVTSDPNIDLYARNSGYTSVERKANIVFEIMPTMKEVVLNDTTQLAKWEAGCDSVFNAQTKYFTFTTDTIFEDVEGVRTPVDFKNDTTWYNDKVDGAEPFETGFYSYYKIGEYTTLEPDSIFGNAGFDDFNPSTIDLQQVSKTGMFVYNKRPSFFGREDVRYRIYNSLLPNVRKSNEAVIQILCGNETVGDSTTVFLIPNAFSPNGDGYNDVFEILLPYQYEMHSESSLEVFNRWGTLVYRSSGNQYGRDCPWWDGTSKTSNMLTLGEKLPSGTYFYVYKITFIDASNDSKLTRKLNGFIELRR